MDTHPVPGSGSMRIVRGIACDVFSTKEKEEDERRRKKIFNLKEWCAHIGSGCSPEGQIDVGRIAAVPRRVKRRHRTGGLAAHHKPENQQER